MNKAAFDMNTFWFYTVFLHIAGSIIFSLMGFLPLGTILCLTALWGIFLYISEKNQKNIVTAAAGWLVTGGLTLVMPVSYGSSLLMNLLMLLLVYYVCTQRRVSLWKYCSFQWIPLRQWGILLLLVVAFLIIASYINAISMLFVQNLTAASLQGAGDYFVQSVIVFAILPAVTEEILFRGYIFRGIENKNVAIFVSALMFALLHMNFNQISYAFIMGLLFALVIRMTDNLSATVVVHLLFNCYSIFTSTFPENPVSLFLQNISIGGYRILSATFVGESNHFDMGLFGAGSLVAVVSLFLVGVLLWLLYKERQDIRKESERGEKSEGAEGLPWKPDRSFWAGCLACLAIAVSYEWLL